MTSCSSKAWSFICLRLWLNLRNLIKWVSVCLPLCCMLLLDTACKVLLIVGRELARWSGRAGLLRLMLCMTCRWRVS